MKKLHSGIGLAALGVGLSLAAHAAETTFTGTGDWSDANRWSAGVPGAADDAILGDGAATTLGGGGGGKHWLPACP